MRNLPWLPRPLIVFATICGRATPCVQWHGQDWQGKVTQEQMLFPIYGKGSELIEVVRPEYWMVAFLGPMNAWNVAHPDNMMFVEQEGIQGASKNKTPVIKIITNELFLHETFPLICPVVQLGTEKGLHSPLTYENPDAQDELPHHGLDSNLQERWRKPYLDSESGNPSYEMDRILRRLGLFSDIYPRRYLLWKSDPSKFNWKEPNIV